MVTEMFVAATPQSLVILDELADGTSASERLPISRGIMWGFSQIGCGTVLVTHNYELAHMLVEEGSKSVKFELRTGKPTYKASEGIASSSGADRVAEKVQFSKDDIAESLRQRGLIQ